MTPPDQPAKLKPLPEVCPTCRGSGFMDGFMWATEPEAKAHAAEGAQFCWCPDGETVRQIIGAI